MQERLIRGVVITLLFGMGAGVPAAAAQAVSGAEDLRLTDEAAPQLCEAATGECQPLDAEGEARLVQDRRLRERFASGELGRPEFGPRVLATGALASVTPGFAMPVLDPILSPAVADGLLGGFGEAAPLGQVAGSLLPDARIPLPLPLALADLLRDIGF